MVEEIISFHEKLEKTENKEYNSASSLPPCRICTGVASGIHYGVNTCEACKAFFRRSLTQKDDLVCLRNGGCQITDKKRGNCSSCRLKKCLDAGMSRDAVRHGRYTIAIRTKNILEVKKLEGKELVLSSHDPVKTAHFRCFDLGHKIPSEIPLFQDSTDSFSDDDEKVANIDSSSRSSAGSVTYEDVDEAEIHKILTLIVSTQETIYPNLNEYLDKSFMEKKQREFHNAYIERVKANTEMFGSLSFVPKEEFKKVYLETGIDIDNRLELLSNHASHIQRSIIKFINFARVIPGFIDLTTEDKINLVKNSRFEYWLLGHYGHFHPDLGVSVGHEIKVHRDELKKMWGNTDEYQSAVHDACRALQNMNFNLEEIAVLRGIVLTFPDRCTLNEPEKIEKIHWKLVNCLLYILNKNSSSPGYRFSMIIDRLINMRALTEMNKKISQNLDIEWVVLKNYPLVCELMTA